MHRGNGSIGIGLIDVKDIGRATISADYDVLNQRVVGEEKGRGPIGDTYTGDSWVSRGHELGHIARKSHIDGPR
jgi:hypothetical protein